MKAGDTGPSAEGCLDQGAGKTAPTFTEIRSRNGYDPYKEGFLFELNRIASRFVRTFSEIMRWKTKNQIQESSCWYEGKLWSSLFCRFSSHWASWFFILFRRSARRSCRRAGSIKLPSKAYSRLQFPKVSERRRATEQRHCSL